MWSPDGRQIYYVEQEGAGWTLMAVDVTPGDELQVDRPVPLITDWPIGAEPLRTPDVFPDGSFVIVPREDERGQLERLGGTELHVVLNWFEELKERVGN